MTNGEHLTFSCTHTARRYIAITPLRIPKNLWETVLRLEKRDASNSKGLRHREYYRTRARNCARGIRSAFFLAMTVQLGCESNWHWSVSNPSSRDMYRYQYHTVYIPIGENSSSPSNREETGFPKSLARRVSRTKRASVSHWRVCGPRSVFSPRERRRECAITKKKIRLLWKIWEEINPGARERERRRECLDPLTAQNKNYRRARRICIRNAYV